MIVGQTIYKMDGNPYYTPEISSEGLGAVFSVNVINIVGSPTVTITVEDRAISSSAFSTVDTFANITATGVATKSASPINNYVRLKIEFAAGDQATDGIHIEVAAPTWRWY